MTSELVEQLKADASGLPYLGKVAYDAFWDVARSTGAATGHVPFSELTEDAQWAWHAAGVASVDAVR